MTERIDESQAPQEQFAAYFAARFHAARRRAYLLCGDWHRADDVAQNAFVRLASSWHRVRDSAALDAYLRTCLPRSFNGGAFNANNPRAKRAAASPPCHRDPR